MARAARIGENAHDLAASVHRKGTGAHGARDVDCGEDALVQEKTVLRTAAIDVETRDLAAIIDPERRGERGARDINRDKTALIHQKTVLPAAVYEFAHDQAEFIDSPGLSAPCDARGIDDGEAASI